VKKQFIVDAISETKKFQTEGTGVELDLENIVG
jgi:hypothetical protein